MKKKKCSKNDKKCSENSHKYILIDKKARIPGFNFTTFTKLFCEKCGYIKHISNGTPS